MSDYSPHAGLIRRARRGDRGATERLMAECYVAVGGWIHAQVPDPDDADEIVQETVVAVYRQLLQLRSERAFWSWVSRISRNELRQFYRKTPVEPPPMPEQGHGRIEDELVSRMEARRIREELETGMDGLPPSQREAFELMALRQLTSSEAAAKLGTAPVTVRTNLSRARKKLAQWMSPSRSAA